MAMMTYSRRKTAIKSELEKIRKKNTEKKLLPDDVVDAAAHPDHPLHGDFNWDDTSAAHEHRLSQARELIRCVILEDDATGKKMPAYVSLMDDRKEKHGGYRSTEEVVNSPAHLAALDRTAKSELQSWTRRYQMLTGLVADVAAAAGIKAPALKRKAK
jgi:hypothetical protein